MNTKTFQFCKKIASQCQNRIFFSNTVKQVFVLLAGFCALLSAVEAAAVECSLSTVNSISFCKAGPAVILSSNNGVRLITNSNCNVTNVTLPRYSLSTFNFYGDIYTIAPGTPCEDSVCFFCSPDSFSRSIPNNGGSVEINLGQNTPWNGVSARVGGKSGLCVLSFGSIPTTTDPISGSTTYQIYARGECSGLSGKLSCDNLSDPDESIFNGNGSVGKLPLQTPGGTALCSPGNSITCTVADSFSTTVGSVDVSGVTSSPNVCPSIPTP